MATFDYIGSKHSIAPALKDRMIQFIGTPLRGLIFGDFMSGTGAMSKMAIEAGCTKVISNDVLEFCRLLTTVHTEKKVDKQKLKRIIDKIHQIFDQYDNSPNEPIWEELPAKFFICNQFSGIETDLPKDPTNRMFFTKMNGYKLDTARQVIDRLYRQALITDAEKDALVASVLMAANKVSNVSVVFGAYLNKFKPAALENLKLVLNVSDNQVCDHVVHKMDVFALLKKVDTSEIDVMYYDPPYNSRRYDKNYSVPETIALYDNPELEGLTGLRIEDGEAHKSFCHKSKAVESFDRLIKETKSEYIFVSYSSESLLEKGKVMELLQKYRKTVIPFEFNYKRFKAQQVVKEGAGPVITEYLFAAKGIKEHKEDIND